MNNEHVQDWGHHLYHHHHHHLYHHDDDDDSVQGLALQLSDGSQLVLHTVAALATLVAGCQVLVEEMLVA